MNAGSGLQRAALLPLLAALHDLIACPLITDRADTRFRYSYLGFWVKSPRYHFAETTPFSMTGRLGLTTRRKRLQRHGAGFYIARLHKSLKASYLLCLPASLMTDIPRRDFSSRVGSLLRRACTGYTGRVVVEIGYQVEYWAEPSVLPARRTQDVDAGEKLPVRLDFFGDEIETVRRFDPASQRTVENLESILITPAREFIAVGADGRPPEDGLSEFHIPLLHQQSASLLDYLPQKALILVDDLSIVERCPSGEQACQVRQDLLQTRLSPRIFLCLFHLQTSDNLAHRSFWNWDIHAAMLRLTTR